MRYYENITELIGNTPLVKIQHLSGKNDAMILAKMESFNPLWSIKDRIAKSMIETAEADGKINKDTVIIEPTSGNTGIGLSYICAVKGYKIQIVMPDSMSKERRQIMQIFGADLILTPGSEGMGGAIRKAEELHKNTANSFMPSQFTNPANPEIHRKTTAEEIWNDTDGKIDILIAGVGTGGTITGIGETLKKKNPNIQIVAVEPEGSPVLSQGKAGPHKIQGIGAGFIPEILNTEIIDEIFTVADSQAGETARALAKKEGIFVGISSGASMFTALNIAKRPENQGKIIVCILPDLGERYLSTWLFDMGDK